ncbi:MAG: prenyltransferase/squalene oxidase repeat-containing protein [Planctomycetota bacterium]
MFGFLTCWKIRKDFHGCLRGWVTREERERVKTHLDACPACREAFTATRKIHKAWKALPAVEPSPSFFETLYARVDALETPARRAEPVRRISEIFTDLRRFHRVTPATLSFALQAGLTAVILVSTSVWVFMEFRRPAPPATPHAIPLPVSVSLDEPVAPYREINIVEAPAPIVPEAPIDIPDEIDMPPLIAEDDPFTGRDIPRPGVGPAAGAGHPSLNELEWKRPELYASRAASERILALFANGGAGSESAVEAGLQWLARTQDSDGGWNPGRHGGDTEYQASATALALLAFLGRDATQTTGDYALAVRRGLQALKRGQSREGFFAFQLRDSLFQHALATLAYTESYGLTGDRLLRIPLEKAVQAIHRAQNTDGGWGFAPGRPSDPAVTAWTLAALRGAFAARIRVSKNTVARAYQFLESRLDRRTGAATRTDALGHRLPDPAGTAACLFAAELIQPLSPALKKLARQQENWLLKNLPRESAFGRDANFWYFGTLALFQRHGPGWETWNTRMKETLIRPQVTVPSGREDLFGSWPASGMWAGPGGRVTSTATAVLCLESYFRYKTPAESKAKEME